jgi:serine/threonine-protein kinase TTK/MPS1
MSNASPTPMPNSNNRILRRQPSKPNNFASSLPSRPSAHRTNAMRPPTPADDSDDEVPLPPSFDSLGQSPAAHELSAPLKRVRNPIPVRERTTPNGSPRRVVRLNSSVGIGSGSLARSGSLRNSVRKEAEIYSSTLEAAASTPLPEPRRVRIHVGGSGRGSSARSNRAISIPLSEGEDSIQPEDPVTVARPLPGGNQSSIQRYGQSTIDRTRGGADTGVYNSIRAVKRVGVGKFGGTLMSGPARRGKLRKSEEVGQSPGAENGRFLENEAPNPEENGDYQEPASEVQHQEADLEAPRSSVHAPLARDLLTGSPRRVRIPSRRNSPRDFAESFPSASRPRSRETTPNGSLPIAFKIPPPRVDIPSTHDQENEPPPTFNRPRVSSILADKLEKSIREKVETVPKQEPAKVIQAVISPERRALQPRSQNTPHRPAPPPPKLTMLDMATATAGRSTATTAKTKRNVIKVNGKIYHRLGELGKGGSSRVFTVMAESQKIFALKRVSLDEADEAAMIGYKGEIELLEKLRDVDRVITLYDYEINEAKRFLYIVSSSPQN